jgi:hypothetical protein|tara:strand:+ start:2066 stop:2530 length:465 start_codon:yes stop_codon:yes gene_type:complete
MKYFAFYSNSNVVAKVIPVPDSANEEDFARRVGMFCKETFKDESSRGKFAGVGDNYLPEHDIFVSPQPFNSWIVDVDKAEWVAPVAKPSDDGEYLWNEFTFKWQPAGIAMTDAADFLNDSDLQVLQQADASADPQQISDALSSDGRAWLENNDS